MNTTNVRNFRAAAIRSLPLPMFQPNISPTSRMLAIEEELFRVGNAADDTGREDIAHPLRSCHLALAYAREEVERMEERLRPLTERERKLSRKLRVLSALRRIFGRDAA